MLVNAKHMVSWPAHCDPLTITGQLLQLHQHRCVSSGYRLDQNVHHFSILEQCSALSAVAKLNLVIVIMLPNQLSSAASLGGWLVLDCSWLGTCIERRQSPAKCLIDVYQSR